LGAWAGFVSGAAFDAGTGTAVSPANVEFMGVLFSEGIDVMQGANVRTSKRQNWRCQPATAITADSSLRGSIFWLSA
jgi:hypothetical protein